MSRGMFGPMDWRELPALLRMLGFEASRELVFQLTVFNAIPEAEKFDGFLSVSEGISGLISKRDLEF